MPTATKSRVMLDEWARCVNERRVITEFWEWLEKKEITALTEVNIEKLLDEYHGINRRQLETERRALLAEFRKLAEED